MVNYNMGINAEPKTAEEAEEYDKMLGQIVNNFFQTHPEMAQQHKETPKKRVGINGGLTFNPGMLGGKIETEKIHDTVDKVIEEQKQMQEEIANEKQQEAADANHFEQEINIEAEEVVFDPVTGQVYTEPVEKEENSTPADKPSLNLLEELFYREAIYRIKGRYQKAKSFLSNSMNDIRGLIPWHIYDIEEDALRKIKEIIENLDYALAQDDILNNQFIDDELLNMIESEYKKLIQHLLESIDID